MELSIEQIQANRITRLKQARHDAGLSLADVSEALAVNKSTIARWESGFISGLKLPHLKKLADMYGVSEQWLFGYDVPRIAETAEHVTKRNEINELLVGVSDADLDRVYQMIKLMLGKDESK